MTDGDGDGYPDDEDCAPEDAAVHPGAEDPWGDGVDSNCDAADGVDLDGDGWPANSDPEGLPPDCDDGNPAAWPGRPWEDPVDGLDGDCDGAHPARLDAARAASIYDEAFSEAGWVLIGGHDITGDGVPDLVVGAPRWADWAGKLMVFSGVDLLGSDLGEEDAWAVVQGFETLFGQTVSFLPDIDGDGLPDLIAGGQSRAWVIRSSFVDEGGSSRVDDVAIEIVGPEDRNAFARTVWGSPAHPDLGSVVYGGFEPVEESGGAFVFDLSGVQASSIDHTVAATELSLPYGGTPFRMAAVDFDGDDTFDLAVTREGDGVEILSGATLASSDTIDSMDLVLHYPEPWQRSGVSLIALRDLTGDGLGELATGARQDFGLEEERGPGVVHLVQSEALQAVGAEGQLDEVGSALAGELVDDAFGSFLAAADVDGDGLQDLIVSAPGARYAVELQSRGLVYVYRGADLAEALATDEIPAPAAAFGYRDGDWVTGYAVTSLGDINADGLEDFAVKAEHRTEPLTRVDVVLGYAP